MDGDGPATVEVAEAIEKEWQILRDEADSAQAWLEEHRMPQSAASSLLMTASFKSTALSNVIASPLAGSDITFDMGQVSMRDR
jgi:hypothetical protein